MESLTVESIDTVIVDIPTVRPHRFSTLSIDHQSHVIARLRTAQGVEGIGEAVVPGGPWWGGESVESIKVMIDTYLAPTVVGQEVTRVERILAGMDRVAARNSYAKACVEMALYDAWGRAWGVPVHQLLGGLYRDAIPVTWALGAEDAAEVTAEAEELLAAGRHQSFKLKMGAAAPKQDVERVLAVARALGESASIRVDLNTAWDELTAQRWLPVLEDGGIDLIEQPVPGWNLAAMARLSQRLTIPVMADESLRSTHDAVEICSGNAADVLSVKVHKLGGLAAVRKVAAIAEAAGVPCHGGTSIETSVGTAAAAHVYCADPGVSYGSEIFGPLLLADDIVEEPLSYAGGELAVPRGAGLGVQLDLAKLAKFQRE